MYHDISFHFSTPPPQGPNPIHYWKSIHIPARIRISCTIWDAASVWTMPATSDKGGKTHGEGVEGRQKIL